MTSSDGRVWHVVSYPAGITLHTTDTYEQADAWRLANQEASIVLPDWPTH
jgi:hypothetical protein